MMKIKLLIFLCFYHRSERERNAANGIRKNNFMVDRNVEDMADDNLVLVTQPVKDLCSSVDAFIYVVDSKISSKTGVQKAVFMFFVSFGSYQ